MAGTQLGVDVGGTFTDLVAFVDGTLLTAKVPSTPHDQSDGVRACIAKSGVDRASIIAFAHGMTVATNALLERQGARIALITTEGFRDILEIGRQNRPSLYDLTRDRPPALVPREMRFTVKERMGPNGEIAPLDEASLAAAIRAVQHADADAVAVCLLFSFLHPEHERRIGAALREALPELHVSLSSEVLPEFREYERFSTTAADAYLAPTLAAYLNNLAAGARQSGIPEPTIMQSSGGVVPIPDAIAHAAACAVSGPAGGVIGAAYVAAASGYDDLLTFDMGGTSTDVAPVIGGRAQMTTEAIIAGVPIKLPMVDVHTVSAGGGSIAWIDPGGALRVGPRSAGADPGPAAYGKGGTAPTVTDATLYLGYIADGSELGGEVVLQRSLSEQALVSLGNQLGLSVDKTALGIIHITEAEMLRALKVISVERGLDPREFALIAFGGAGGIHACALAEELGITTVLIPKVGGVLSALGLAIADVRRDYVRSMFADMERTDLVDIDRGFKELEAIAARHLSMPTLSRYADLQYRGQSFELTVNADNLDACMANFHAAHEQRYGYRMEGESVQLVNLRLVATKSTERPELYELPGAGEGEIGIRRANFDGLWREIPVFGRDRMGSGDGVDGPAIVEFREATCVVRPGWHSKIDSRGTLIMERQ